MSFEREGERPRESPSFGIRGRQGKLGSRGDARPPHFRVSSVFHPWLKVLVSWRWRGRLRGDRAAEDTVAVGDHDAGVLGAGLLDDGVVQVADKRAAGVV